MRVGKIKIKTREIILMQKPSMLGVAIVFVSICTLFTYFANQIAGVSMTETELMQYYDMFLSGNTEEATEYAKAFFPSIEKQLFGLLLELSKIILAGGFLIFVRNAILKNGEACLANLLDGFGIAHKLILMKLIRYIVIGAGLILFIAPGVILFYLYRQSYFLLIDHPDWSVFKCLKESRKMMKGNQKDLIVLDINLLPVLIMNLVPMAGIFAEPFTKTAYFLYYESLVDKDKFEEILATKYMEKNDRQF